MKKEHLSIHAIATQSVLLPDNPFRDISDSQYMCMIESSVYHDIIHWAVSRE